MFELIDRIHLILNTCKDFIAGYSCNKEDQMIIKYKDKFYKIYLKEVEAPKVTDRLRKKYNNCKDDEIIQLGELLKWKL